MFKKEKRLSLTKLLLRLSIALIFSLGLISSPDSTILASGTIKVKDYIKDKFPSVIYNIYLASLNGLDQHEKEFIDLLQNLPEAIQRNYAKEVYNDGFTQELLALKASMLVVIIWMKQSLIPLIGSQNIYWNN